MKVEETINWASFLETLKKDQDIINTAPCTIMSNKQKVLLTKHLHLYVLALHLWNYYFIFASLFTSISFLALSLKICI
jgi:hypothetical protein